ncbi:MAG TPA: hypothetical protein VLZ12_00815 [Verrucomicrobiae bacterium]|nr:hypothetical protein [Verrucomicrobiae bacterium]
MRSLTWWLCLVVAAVGLFTAGNPIVVHAEDEQQEQRDKAIPPLPPQIGPERQIPMVRVVPPPEVLAALRAVSCGLKCVAWTMLVVHVLLAVWVFMDIRKRGEGHGIFIALALLGGIPAAILYALVRLGDKKS